MNESFKRVRAGEIRPEERKNTRDFEWCQLIDGLSNLSDFKGF